MNWVDIVSLVVWGVAALWGLQAGLVKTWIPFSFVIAGLWIAGDFGGWLGQSFSGFIESENRQTLAGFFVIYAAMLLMGGAIAYAASGIMSLASPVVSLVPFGALFNRFGGLIMGAVMGGILLAVALSGLQQYPVAEVSAAVSESSLGGVPVGWFDR